MNPDLRKLLQPVNPVVRLPVQMCKCKNDYFVILNGIEDPEEEFVDNVSPDFLAFRRPCLGVLLNSVKGVLNLFSELRS